MYLLMAEATERGALIQFGANAKDMISSTSMTLKSSTRRLAQSIFFKLCPGRYLSPRDFTRVSRGKPVQLFPPLTPVLSLRYSRFSRGPIERWNDDSPALTHRAFSASSCHLATESYSRCLESLSLVSRAPMQPPRLNTDPPGAAARHSLATRQVFAWQATTSHRHHGNISDC